MFAFLHAHARFRGEFQAWVGSTGDWTTAILPTVSSVMSWMKSNKGSEIFGVVGFCWGGKMAMQAASMGPESGVVASGCVHPAMLSPELANEVGSSTPMFLPVF